MLTIIENLLSKEEVRHFLRQLEQGSWHAGIATAGAMAQQAKNNRQIDDDSELAIRLGNHILQKLGQSPLFISAALPRTIHPPKFNRYAVGETYGAHVDSAIMRVPGSLSSLRSDLAATLFLSEPDSYDGGELEIEGSFGVQEIKLEAGDMVVYPASSVHRVTPVTRGERCASFFWIESLVGDAGQRDLLFDLDQSIQGLAATLPLGDANLIKLTGVYHNLLRRWAHT